MARPLSTSDVNRSGINFNLLDRTTPPEIPGHGPVVETAKRPSEHGLLRSAVGSRPAPDPTIEIEHLRAENAQLRTLCHELEQALHEATQQVDQGAEARCKEYEALVEEKSETIRALHLQLEEAHAAMAELEAQGGKNQSASRSTPAGPVPREDELLALSEELERERRQLQEDEQALMEQMREMEVGMAKERADLARQRNDLQRLQGEIRHELERLEKNGALQAKIENLKSKFQDATNRRGAAPSSLSSSHAGPVEPGAGGQTAPKKSDSVMGRWFGQNGSR